MLFPRPLECQVCRGGSLRAFKDGAAKTGAPLPGAAGGSLDPKLWCNRVLTIILTISRPRCQETVVAAGPQRPGIGCHNPAPMGRGAGPRKLWRAFGESAAAGNPFRGIKAFGRTALTLFDGPARVLRF